jgi:hypothetical protein
MSSPVPIAERSWILRGQAGHAYEVEGSFDLSGQGFDGPWGVEILSKSFRALPVADALKLAAESTLTVLG